MAHLCEGSLSYPKEKKKKNLAGWGGGDVAIELELFGANLINVWIIFKYFLLVKNPQTSNLLSC